MELKFEDTECVSFAAWWVDELDVEFDVWWVDELDVEFDATVCVVFELADELVVFVWLTSAGLGAVVSFLASAKLPSSFISESN